jgi:mono/diheme cytochrome c family protein
MNMTRVSFCALMALAIPALAAAPPTYNKDIAPILNTQCALCHRPGEVAPFSLLNYQDAAKRAALIANVTQKRLMPPWKPEAGFGKFQHERRLSDDQIALLGAWAKAGAPEGNPADKPPAPSFAAGWQGGEPTAVFKTGHGFNVPADGPDLYQCFVIPLNNEQESYIQTAEFRPGNPSVVHHGIIYVDESGGGRKLAANSPDGSYSCFGGPRVNAALVDGWAPGTLIPPGDPQLSIPVKKGADLIVQLHYHPSGKPETDISTVGITYSGPPSKGRLTYIVSDEDIDIAPGDSHYVVRHSLRLTHDVQLSTIYPHAHWLGKDLKIDARFPNGETSHLVWIKDWDFNWQGGYRYETPVQLSKGTLIELQYTYDNSGKNPHNPSNPPIPVKYGEQTNDEMAVALLTLVLPSPADVAPFRRDTRLGIIEDIIAGNDYTGLRGRIPGYNAARTDQLVKQYDKNGDGKLDTEEGAALMEFIGGLIK